MRGVAALSAALAVWMLRGGSVPRVRWPLWRWPTVRELRRPGLWGGGALLLAQAISGLLLIAGVVGLLVAATLVGAQQATTERRRRALAEQWPDFLAILRSRLAAGLPLPEASVEAAVHTGEPMESIGRDLERSLAQNRSFAEALECCRQELADPIADRVLISLVFAARAGGGRVADILGMLGQSVGDELRLRRAHDAALTQQRLTAGVALAAPWALLLLTVATNPQAAAAYGTPGGTKVVGLGLAMTSAGFLLARRSARLARAARVFR